jgi:hypothetical protein
MRSSRDQMDHIRLARIYMLFAYKLSQHNLKARRKKDHQWKLLINRKW